VTDVLFRPEVERLPKDKQRAWFGAPQMIDRGDHVDYFDGRHTHSWRLPGQSGDYPEVATLLIAGFEIAVGSHIANYRVLFLDRNQQILGRLNYRDRVFAEHYDAVLPESALTTLIQRGVQVVRKTYRDGPSFFREYPEAARSTSERRFMQHPVRWILAGLVLLIIVVNLILLATGYYG